MSASFVDNGYHARYEFGDEISFRFEGGQYTEYVFAGPRMPDILEAYTWLTGPRSAAAAVGARLPPVPLVRLHAGRGRGDRRAAPRRRLPCDALWLDIDYMDGYRVFTWDTERFPDVPGMMNGSTQHGLRR